MVEKKEEDNQQEDIKESDSENIEMKKIIMIVKKTQIQKRQKKTKIQKKIV